MIATDILKSEHRVIERVLASLDQGVDLLEAGYPIRPGYFIDTADFIKGFADGCHHKKEEDVLFPALVASGVPSDDGPVGVMLSEHEQGRAYVKAMRAAAQRLETGNPAARTDLAKAARGYTRLLHDHIAKEDGILYPMADQFIPDNQKDQVIEDFEHIEHEETGEGVHEKYLALAEKLENEISQEQSLRKDV